ncbi:MAG: clostripain-related cysteine peptidase [Caldilineaceae bacterium]
MQPGARLLKSLLTRPIFLFTIILSLCPTVPAHAAPSPATEREWLVMLYQNADDPILEGDIFIDLNEAELVGSSDAVTIVSQLDRYDGEFDGDGDWTSAKRFLVTQDGDLNAIGSKMVKDLGEVDSGSPNTLVDFAVWAMTTYPARKYALILSDHGAGWVGGWNDDAPKAESSLTINEIDQALAAILSRTKVAQFELLGFDACLMSEVEALAGVAPYARYAVASQETEPALGWAYAKFLGGLNANPRQSGADLAKSIVKSYIVNDIRIVDDKARRAFLQETGEETTVTAKALGATMSEDVTLTAINLTKFAPLMAALNEFAYTLTMVDPAAIAKARTYAQSFETVFAEEEPSPYLDLGHFATLVTKFANSPKLTAANKKLQSAYKAAILAEVNGPARPGASGFSIFFPTPDLLVEVGTAASEQSYTAYASRFAGASLWDDFLAFHYTNRDFDPDGAVLDLLNPQRGRKALLRNYAAPLLTDEDLVSTPGIDTELTMTPLEVSEEEITAGDTLLLGTQISGENVGYIYIEVTRYDEENDVYILEDMDFIASEESAVQDGVYYPLWTQEDMDDFVYEWSPTVYALDDGKTEAFALFEPSVYGKTEHDTEYTVRGIYTFADSDQARYALMSFDGDLTYKNIFGYVGANGTGALREIRPRKGDTFTILEQWYEQDKTGEWIITEHEGDTLTFQGKPFTATAYESYPGEYSLGIIVNDILDNSIAEYVTVQVVEQ